MPKSPNAFVSRGYTTVAVGIETVDLLRDIVDFSIKRAFATGKAPIVYNLRSKKAAVETAIAYMAAVVGFEAQDAEFAVLMLKRAWLFDRAGISTQELESTAKAGIELQTSRAAQTMDSAQQTSQDSQDDDDGAIDAESIRAPGADSDRS